ncbi:MAG: iron-sulfur cluster repair di-iron protein [Ignavibacteriaceae bacterium]|nr:iron-sulfur cluster repair di-iron protein [Ignavibacteriaceae bacterium]
MSANADDTTVKNDFAKMTLKEIVTNNFRTASVLEKYGMDFCCRGNKLFTEACDEKGLDTRLLEAELKKVNLRNMRDERYDDWTLDFLIDYIIQNHHSYIKEITPILLTHTKKVASAHGANHPEVLEIATKFESVAMELKHHLIKEEEILFPYIKLLVQVNSRHAKAEPPFFGTVKNPIESMMAEHEIAGDTFYAIREISNQYTAPADACNTFKAAYQELKDFEEDLHKHVHLENNILFPKAIELEKKSLT